MSEEQVSHNNTEDASAQVENEANKSAIEETTTEPFYKDETKSEDKADAESSKGEQEDNEHKSEDEEKGSEDSEDLELIKPKDSQLTDADMDRIAAYAKEQGLSKDAANKLVEVEAEAKETFMNDLQQEHDQRAEEWVNQVKADKELGGQNFEQSVSLAKKAAEKFGGEGFIEMLNESGFGNHPEVVRVFSRIGRAMNDDDFVKGGVHSGGQKSMEDLFYSTNNE
jgi:hypothetical protein